VPSCSEAGVLGVLPGLLGTIQATEALKLAAGIGEPLTGRLLLVDGLSMRFRTIQVRRDPRCPACGTREIRELREESAACAADSWDAVPEVDPAELSARLRDGEPVQLLDIREAHEWEVARIPGARHAPMSRLDGALAGLDPARDTVLYCRTGVRSQEAGRRLRAAGFPRVFSLAGGILRYGAEFRVSG
jgi:adenylyltransferase/sulfurtransferase